MVRMLGFSDEDKQRVGVAQQGAGKSVVRGVLGIPGRFVGGIIGSRAPEESHSDVASDQVISCQQPCYILSLSLSIDFFPVLHVHICLLISKQIHFFVFWHSLLLQWYNLNYIIIGIIILA